MIDKDKLWQPIIESQDYAGSARLAVEALNKAAAFDAIHIIGLYHVREGDEQEGIPFLDFSLEWEGCPAGWYTNTALAFQSCQDYSLALEYVEAGLVRFPDEVRLNYLRGVLLSDLKLWPQALGQFEATIELHPDFFPAQINRGFCLQMLDRFDEEVELYKQIVDVVAPPYHDEVVNNWACALSFLGRPHEALELLEHHTDDPAGLTTVFNKSFLYLGLGMWPKGWELYQSRHEMHRRNDPRLGALPKLSASLKDIRGRHLFLIHEQGFGDSIQFVRYARLLHPHVASLTIGVPKSLERLVKQLDLPGRFSVTTAEQDGDLLQFMAIGCDVSLYMMDAPAILGQRVDDIPIKPYFRPVPEEMLAEHSLERFTRSGKFRVGLCWAGMSRNALLMNSIDRRRSIPFDLLAPFVRAFSSDVDFVSLQQPNNRVSNSGMVHPIQDTYDWLDTAAIISQLDLVITVDTAVCHLAAALGRPTWMLSRFDGCWRWFFEDREDTPWYPSMRIYRQPQAWNWRPVLEHVAHDLLKLLEQHATGQS